ncbi:MAG: TetR/AcrR family transcriptional regulator [Pseudoclavibacter sp.]
MSRGKTPGRRDALLAAGRQVFADQDGAQATIDDVVATAGVAKGTFYLYFHSKADLVLALRQQFADRLAAELTTIGAAASPVDWPSVSRRLVEAAVDGYLGADPGDAAILRAAVTDPGDPDNAEWADAIVRAIAEFLARGVEAGALTVDDPEATALLLYAAVGGACHRALATGTPARDRILAAMNRLLTGIVPEERR